MKPKRKTISAPPNLREASGGRACGDCDFFSMAGLSRVGYCCRYGGPPTWNTQCDDWQMNGSSLPRQTKDEPRWL